MAKKRKKQNGPTQKDFGSFVNVPPGSTFEARIKGEKGKFGADGQFISGTSVTQWTKAQLMPGPAMKKLSAMRSYFAEVRLAFLAASKPTVSFRVLKPDGSVHSKRLKWTIDGKKGTSQIRGAFVQTK